MLELEDEDLDDDSDTCFRDTVRIGKNRDSLKLSACECGGLEVKIVNKCNTYMHIR